MFFCIKYYPHERIDQMLLCYGGGDCGLWRRGGPHLLAPRYFVNDVLIRSLFRKGFLKLPIQRIKTWLSGSTCLPNARFCREYSWPQNTWWHLHDYMYPQQWFAAWSWYHFESVMNTLMFCLRLSLFFKVAWSRSHMCENKFQVPIFNLRTGKCFGRIQRLSLK